MTHPALATSSFRFIVLTGGPGAGKTAVMEAARQMFPQNVVILPEAASVVYSGGFPRIPSRAGVHAAQRAICRVQEELERFAVEEGTHLVALCDRGIADGAAYWPEGADSFFTSIGLRREAVFARYHTVIHLHTPTLDMGYNLSNPMRTETPEQAALLDERIERAWAGHPNRIVVPAKESFTEKLEHVTELIAAALPSSPALASALAAPYASQNARGLLV
jgi:predicted ATPase